MLNNFKNKTSLPAGRQGGFIGIIIMIVIVLLIMKYYGLTITGILNWIWNLITSVF